MDKGRRQSESKLGFCKVSRFMPGTNAQYISTDLMAVALIERRLESPELEL